MPMIRDVCRVRSKNAGPYWVTVDLFFNDDDSYRRYARSEALGAATFARVFDADIGAVKHFPIDDLNVLKVSYPRATAQGGMVERDLHCGQQFARLLDLELS